MSRPEAAPFAALTPRYRGIIPDWPAFEAACSRPVPLTLRTNTLRIDPEALRRRLVRAGFDATPTPWDETLLRVDRPVGRRIEHWLGLFYVQEATQTLPVRVLDPREDQAVLDLCAAPGGKTTQAAERMSNRGSLLANEPSGRRQQALLANVNRMGTLNVTVTRYRGESFPMRARFDRILVDAPCSAEGTLRKDASLRGGASPASIERLARLQRRLIVRAYDLLSPGGRMVYSTCTFAPEENEAVVSHLLEARDARLIPVDAPFRTAPGLPTWEETAFDPAVTACARVYPQHLDSGGGFVAHVERPVA